MSDVVATLMAARELLSDPARWTKDMAARDAGGEECLVDDITAASWCSLGAVLKQHPDFKTEVTAFALLEEAANHNVALFNDAPSTTHADILAAFDRAIATAKAAS